MHHPTALKLGGRTIDDDADIPEPSRGRKCAEDKSRCTARVKAQLRGADLHGACTAAPFGRAGRDARAATAKRGPQQAVVVR
jgi:hypothetical protein